MITSFAAPKEKVGEPDQLSTSAKSNFTGACAGFLVFLALVGVGPPSARAATWNAAQAIFKTIDHPSAKPSAAHKDGKSSPKTPGANPGAAAVGRLIWPVRKAGSSVSSCYGSRNLSGVREFHPGFDIAQSMGTPVYAANNGTITIAEPVIGYGNNYVSIMSVDGRFFTGYGHMSSKSVAVGQKVHQGQQIGRVGNEGASLGPHLHFNLTLSDLPHNPWNGNVDPLKFGLKIPAGISNQHGCR